MRYSDLRPGDLLIARSWKRRGYMVLWRYADAHDNTKIGSYTLFHRNGQIEQVEKVTWDSAQDYLDILAAYEVVIACDSQN